METEKTDNIIFGIHPIQEALRNGKAFEHLYVSQGRKGNAIAEILRLAKASHIDVRFEPWERLTARAGKTEGHQGVVGVITSYTYTTFEALLASAQQRQEPPFLLLLDNIQDPHNLGAILRSAECAGVHGVILPKRKSVGITPTVVKASAGAITYLPVCRVTNLATTIEELKKAGIWIVGTSSMASQPYVEADLTLPIAIMIGNEAKGLRRLSEEKCDLLISIPLYGKISALNASVASAIIMFEVRRQRKLTLP